MTNTSIEWTEATWNPVTGCSKVSPGCDHCYAERMAKRLQAMGQANYADGFAVRTHEHMLELPQKWRRPHHIFVNSMGDLFHEQVPLEFVSRVFAVMASTPQHTYQLLTKRAQRMEDLSGHLEWPDNVWAGVTVEDNVRVERLGALRKVPAAVRFVSIEPLLGPLPDLVLDGLDWVIVGGESGPGSRAVDASWILDIRDQCVAEGVPFFFKQWGGTRKKRAGRELDGAVWSQMPRRTA
jgi:protein gp37